MNQKISGGRWGFFAGERSCGVRLPRSWGKVAASTVNGRARLCCVSGLPKRKFMKKLVLNSNALPLPGAALAAKDISPRRKPWVSKARNESARGATLNKH